MPPTSTPSPTPTPTISDAEAARFLTQATFGVTRADIDRVKALGYSGWIDEQMSLPATLILPHLQSVVANGYPRQDVNYQMRRNFWLWQAATARDQLRLRMGLALSEILVVSELEFMGNHFASYRIADYQDTLARGAFGSYRDLLGKVSLHPAMGYFLSHVGNRKADPVRNIAPDENYGREILQLFSIGLVRLNPDGTPVLDGKGSPVPTYDEKVVSAMARVFTGFTYDGLTEAQFGRHEEYGHAPMVCHPAYHDDQPKIVFDGIRIDEGNNCNASVARTLDALVRHQNVAPFISRQLIQRFVTSNPSPDYVRRVAGVWTSSQGNLGQVLKAILLDQEARRLPPDSDQVYGKAREPIIKLAMIWRTFGAQYVPEVTGRVLFRFEHASDLTLPIAQDIQRAPSVFNFFSPGHRLPGQDGSEGIQAPEFQILTEANFVSTHNLHASLLWWIGNEGEPVTKWDVAPTVNLGPLISLLRAKRHEDAIEELNLLLFYGQMRPALKATMRGLCTTLESLKTDPKYIARSLIMLSLSSPQFAIQR
jgi:uncharacterized protein (DUF1800 family)